MSHGDALRNAPSSGIDSCNRLPVGADGPDRPGPGRYVARGSFQQHLACDVSAAGIDDADGVCVDTTQRRLGVPCEERQSARDHGNQEAGADYRDRHGPPPVRCQPSCRRLRLGWPWTCFRCCELEHWILTEDRLLEPLQRWARLEPELIAQMLPQLPINVERFGLPATAVERQHQMAVHALAQRILVDERF